MNSRHAPAFAGLLIAVLCWSGNALVARAFYDQIPPLSLSFWRWVLATTLLLPFVARGIWLHRATLRAASSGGPVDCAAFSTQPATLRARQRRRDGVSSQRS